MGEDMDTCMETLGITDIQEVNSTYAARGGRGNNVLWELDITGEPFDESVCDFAKAVSRVSLLLECEVAEAVYEAIHHFDTSNIPSYQLDFCTQQKTATIAIDSKSIRFSYPNGMLMIYDKESGSTSGSKHLEEQHLLLGESELKDALDEILAPVMEVK